MNTCLSLFDGFSRFRLVKEHYCVLYCYYLKPSDHPIGTPLLLLPSYLKLYGKKTMQVITIQAIHAWCTSGLRLLDIVLCHVGSAPMYLADYHVHSLILASEFSSYWGRRDEQKVCGLYIYIFINQVHKHFVHPS